MKRTWPICLLLCLWLSTGSLWAQTPQDFLRQAGSMMERRESEQARHLLERGLHLFPEDPDLLMQLGLLLIRIGDLERGDRFLSEVLRIRPSDHQALQGLAESRIRTGDFSGAKRLFEESLKYRSSDAQTHYRLAFTLFAQGKDDEAASESRQAVLLAPLDAEYRRFHALLLSLQGRKDESLQQLRLARGIDPSDVGTLNTLSQQEWAAGNREPALQLALEATRLDPENPLLRERLSQLYAALGHPAEADRQADEAHRYSEAYRLYLDALAEAGRHRPQQAIDLLVSALKVAPEFTTGRLYLAALYARIGQSQEALRLYSTVLALDPGQPSALAETMRISLLQGSVDVALAALDRSPDPGENDQLLHGYEAMQRLDWGEALSHFEQARQRDPLLPGLLQLIAFCLSRQGRHSSALHQLEMAWKVDPTEEIASQFAETRLERAQALQNQERWEEAAAEYDSLIHEVGPREDFHFGRAYCLQRLGRLHEAIRDYRSALKMRPETEWARTNLASSLYLDRKYAESLQEWRLVVSARPSALGFEQMGLCLSQLSRYAEAESSFEKALSLGESSSSLLYNLGVCRLRLKKIESAWALIRKAARSGYPPARRMVSALPR